MKSGIGTLVGRVILLCLMIISISGFNQALAQEANMDKAEMKGKAGWQGGPKPVGPGNMSTGTVFKPGQFALSLKYITFGKKSLYDGSDEKDGKYNGKYKRTQTVVKATVRYGFTENFDARLVVPYFDKSLYRYSAVGKPKEADHEDGNSGVGDIVLMGRYNLLSQKRGAPIFLSIGAGVKIPTGDSSKKNGKPFNKTYEYMGPGFQLGTGSWDPKIELGITKMFKRSRLDFHMMYTWGLEGDHGLRMGNKFKYDLGYTYAVNRLFDVELELNGVLAEKNENDGKTVENTGGHTVYITPGVHVKIQKGLHASLCVPIVVHRDLNSVPEEDKYGIGEDYQVVFKLAYCH